MVTIMLKWYEHWTVKKERLKQGQGNWKTLKVNLDYKENVLYKESVKWKPESWDALSCVYREVDS